LIQVELSIIQTGMVAVAGVIFRYFPTPSRVLKNYLILAFTTLMSGFAQSFNPPSPPYQGGTVLPPDKGEGVAFNSFSATDLALF